MGPLWSGQGTVPHTTVSDLLSTDVLVSVPGASRETKLEINDNYKIIFSHLDFQIPADSVIVKDMIVLLVLVPKLAVTLTVQLLPGESEDIV